MVQIVVKGRYLDPRREVVVSSIALPQRSIEDLSTTLHQSRDFPIHATTRSIYEYRIDLHSRTYGLYFDRARITCLYIHADIRTRCAAFVVAFAASTSMAAMWCVLSLFCPFNVPAAKQGKPSTEISAFASDGQKSQPRPPESRQQ